MDIYEIGVQKPYLNYILSGQKTIEGRLNKGKFVTMNEGDVLIIGPKKVKFKLIKKTIYPTFKKMLNQEELNCIIPDKRSINEAVKVYYKFYTPKDEKKFGVVALKIKRI